MAIVPVSQGASVEARPVQFVPQQAQFDPNAFGAGIGQATQGLGQAIGRDAEEGAKIATHMAIENDTRAAKASDAQHLKNVTDLGYTNLPGGPEGNKGYYSLQGQDAVTYRPAYEKALNDSNTAISDGLKDSPRAQNFYNSQAGARVQGEVQRSAMYANSHAIVADNNASAARLGAYKDSLTVNYNDPDALANFQRVTRGEVADTGRRMGWGTDQIAEATTKALSGGYRDAILARVTSGDTAGAGAMFQQLAPGMDAGTRVSLAQHLQPIMTAAAADQLVKTLMGTPSAPRGSAPDIYSALKAQEGPGVSIQGANEGLMPGTFQQYAKPGESFSNPEDRHAVNRRVIDDLSQKAGGDPERIAVGYFSGPGNMSAPGSALPYRVDKTDANGKTTSSYVADINRRLGRDGSYQIAGAPVGPPVGNASDANPAIHPDFAGMQQKLLDMTGDNPQLRAAALSRLHTAASQYELSTQADRDKIQKGWNDSIAAATAGNDTVDFNEAMIRHVYRPDIADYMVGQAHEAVQAGQLNSALKMATPEQANRILADLSSGLGPRDTISHLRGKTVVGTPVGGADGPPDMTGQYNTKLSPEEEAKFQAWGVANTKDGRNPANDTFDYDMRGFWKAADGSPQFAGNGHAGDQFKKPNHPTFSDQSQYSGQDGYAGGKWSADGEAKTYTPSDTNIQMHGEGDLQHYFAQREPDYKLNGPDEDPAHYAQRQKALAQAQTFLAQRQKMLTNDPAAYAMQDPTVAAAYAAVDPSKPETVQAAADASFSVQRSLGVTSPRVLGATQAAAMVKKIETPTNGDMGKALNDLESQYGSHYGDVIADLTQAGLSPRYQMLAHANLPEQATVRSDAQAAFQMFDGMKDKGEWSKGVPGDQERLLKPAVDEAVASYRKTLQGSTDPSNTVSTVIIPAITQTAQYYMTRGMPVRAAVDKAATLITASYKFDDELRVPTAPGMPTVSQVRASMTTLTSGLTDADLESADSYNRRTASMSRVPAVGPPTTAAEARYYGTWMTNPDDKGATLYKGTAQGGYMPVRKADGSYLSIDFARLPTATTGVQAAVSQAPAPAAQALGAVN